jgi:hypothetical protein
MKHTSTYTKLMKLGAFLAIFGAAFALEAGRGGNGGGNSGCRGNDGTCPNGFEPGSRTMQGSNCDGTGIGSGACSEYKGRKSGSGNGSGSGHQSGQRKGAGSGDGTGPKRDGSGGNCPAPGE